MKIYESMHRSVLSVTLLMLSGTSFALNVKSVVAAGSGCKANDKFPVSAVDGSLEIAFPVLHSVQANGKKMFRSNCNLSLSLEGEAGKQFKAVAVKTDYETIGTSKDKLSMNFKLWFQGGSKTILLDHQINTSKGTEFRESLSLPINEESWSPCKKENVLNAGVSFNGKNEDGFSTEYTLTQSKGLKIELIWRPCS